MGSALAMECRELAISIKKIDSKIKECECGIDGLRVQRLTDMPKDRGVGKNTMVEARLQRLECLQEQRHKRMLELLLKSAMLEYYIDRANLSGRERAVIFEYYVNGRTWRGVAEALKLSKTAAINIGREAAIKLDAAAE